VRDGAGFAGRVASAFIDSKLTQLVILGSLLVGLFAVVATEVRNHKSVPQDIFVEMPGASAKEGGAHQHPHGEEAAEIRG
jgi:hypothetical protein